MKKMIQKVLISILFIISNSKTKNNNVELELVVEETQTQQEETTEETTQPPTEQPTEQPTQRALQTNVNEIFTQSSFISMNFISQYPELPTGCEVVSLTMVLNYLGYPIDKCTLSDNYLDKGQIGYTDMNVAFIGNPRTSDSYGCYQDPIVNCANRYLAEQNSQYHAIRADNIYSYIDSGIPVIVWATISMMETYYTSIWYVNGIEVKWLANEHCLVLIGYNTSNNTVTIADPLRGIVEYDKSLFELRFSQMGSQAVVIIE